VRGCVLLQICINIHPDAVPPTHAESYHVATDKHKPPPPPPRQTWRLVPVSDNLQPIATRGKKARSTLLVDQHSGNDCSIKRAPLSVSYYNEISGGHIGSSFVRRRCSAGPSVLPLCVLLVHACPLANLRELKSGKTYNTTHRKNVPHKTQ